ncbi:Di-copper centre-containing protein [Stereum hirsutum FP-91666 SS1]|uniref:Di-copper centre-containing protein n=1 Tax=Stereum hirsutum (strain FP-91666) TaxID=721885 RepID=UPI000444A561|nr:Di-copper centre-containing protein [Stereum hirsutum FP-91666 SS1]EIM81501.1 Di-copper centre-containing protein [Stereum hirsutum FP-91666 SS1]
MKSEYSRSFVAKGETGSLLPLLAHESISSENERSCDRQSRSWRRYLFCGLGASALLLLGLFYVSTLGIILPSSETSLSTGVLVRPKCTVPQVRKEWFSFTRAEQLAYFDAELCLINAPSKNPASGATTRYEDLVIVHQLNSIGWYVDGAWTGDLLHKTGRFLPWHRGFTLAHETLLRNECGYTGNIPYWNWTSDAGHFSTAKILTPEHFGSNGIGANHAVVDGPFGNLTLHLGPGTVNTVHTLMRIVDETNSTYVHQKYVDECTSATSYGAFMRCANSDPRTEPIHGGGMHGGVHFGVGGDLTDVSTSPNDPIFWLHHGMLDQVWARWQAENEGRLGDIAGFYDTATEPLSGWRNTTLDTVLDYQGIIPRLTIGDVMDMKGDVMCSVYE